MEQNASQTPSSLLQYLPSIYQRDPFIGQFLLAFEKILIGLEDGQPLPDVDAPLPHPQQGLEQIVDALDTYFLPLETPDDFLPWLAKWTAFTLRADLPADKQRDFIARIIQLYRWRGTKKNMQELLSIFTEGTPTINDASGAEFQLGKHSTVGQDTYLSGGSPYYFVVTIAMRRMAESQRERQLQIARALINLEKPAHTFYDLIPFSPTMIIGKHSTVGVDTILGVPEEE